MSMVLSHGTALEMYRSSLMPVAKWERVPFESLAVPTQDDVLWFRSLPIKTGHFPLHCVVPKASNRREIKGGCCHVFGDQMKAIRLRRNTNGSSLCVVSPEVLFLQMAASLSAIELVRLGFELCGNYSLPIPAELRGNAPWFRGTGGVDVCAGVEQVRGFACQQPQR